MLFSAVAFSVMAALAHALGESLPWQIIAASRTALAFVFASLLTLQSGGRLVLWRPRTLWVRSLAGSVSLVCTFYALTRLPVADVLTLTNVFPVWVALLSWPILGERPSREAWIAIAIALAGVGLVQQPHFNGEKWPVMVALLSSFSTAISMLGLHRLQGVDPRAVVAHFSGVALVVCLCSIGLMPPGTLQSLQVRSPTVAMLLCVGVSATVGQLLLTKAFAAGPPAKVSVVALSQVVFGLMFDVLVWNHSFGWTALLGMLLVMAPTAWMLVSQGRLQTDDL
jgi:drug/metabolite transporter (DMT)-like permease